MKRIIKYVSIIGLFLHAFACNAMGSRVLGSIIRQNPNIFTKLSMMRPSVRSFTRARSFFDRGRTAYQSFRAMPWKRHVAIGFAGTAGLGGSNYAYKNYLQKKREKFSDRQKHLLRQALRDVNEYNFFSNEFLAILKDFLYENADHIIDDQSLSRLQRSLMRSVWSPLDGRIRNMKRQVLSLKTDIQLEMGVSVDVQNALRELSQDISFADEDGESTRTVLNNLFHNQSNLGFEHETSFKKSVEALCFEDQNKFTNMVVHAKAFDWELRFVEDALKDMIKKNHKINMMN
jgi:hypothetical protein